MNTDWLLWESRDVNWRVCRSFDGRAKSNATAPILRPRTDQTAKPSAIGETGGFALRPPPGPSLVWATRDKRSSSEAVEPAGVRRNPSRPQRDVPVRTAFFAPNTAIDSKQIRACPTLT
jgi:hypothetical protein